MFVSVAIQKVFFGFCVILYTYKNIYIAVQRQKIKQNIGFITSVSSNYKKQLSF